MNTSEKPAGGPFASSVDRIRQEFDQFLDSAFQQGGRVLDGIRARQGATWLPPVELIETADRVIYRVEVPGLTVDEIDISLAGNMLTVSGGRDETPLDSDAVVHLQERRQGRFERSIPMPSVVDADQVSAEVSHGVLEIVLPRPAEAMPRQIPVRAPKSSSAGQAPGSTD